MLVDLLIFQVLPDCPVITPGAPLPRDEKGLSKCDSRSTF